MLKNKLITFVNLLIVVLFIIFVVGILVNLPVTYTQIYNQPNQPGNVLQIIQRFSLLINGFLIILIIILLWSLFKAVKVLRQENVKQKRLALMLDLFISEPASVFSQEASRDQRGTYKIPYEKFRSMHLASKNLFIRTLVVMVVQIFVLGFLIYSLTGLNSAFFEPEPAEQQAQNFRLKTISN